MSQYFAVSPSDSVPLQSPARALYVGVSGDIAVKGVDDSVAVTLKAVPAGWFQLPWPIAYVMATNTTATDVVARSVS